MGYLANKGVVDQVTLCEGSLDDLGDHAFINQCIAMASQDRGALDAGERGEAMEYME